MKRYLQACETGGSIYGKNGASKEKDRSEDKHAGKEDLMSACNRLYKNQLAALNKVFQRNR